MLLSGTVKIYVTRADGREVILAFLGPGDTVGEMSLVDSAGRSANVVTTEPSRLLWMDRATFQTCLRTLTPLANNLVRLLAHRLRFANEQIQALCTLDVPGRVARQILAMADRYGSLEDGRRGAHPHPPHAERPRRDRRRLAGAGQSGHRRPQDSGERSPSIPTTGSASATAATSPATADKPRSHPASRARNDRAEERARQPASEAGRQKAQLDPRGVLPARGRRGRRRPPSGSAGAVRRRAPTTPSTRRSRSRAAAPDPADRSRTMWPGRVRRGCGGESLAAGRPPGARLAREDRHPAGVGEGGDPAADLGRPDHVHRPREEPARQGVRIAEHGERREAARVDLSPGCGWGARRGSRPPPAPRGSRAAGGRGSASARSTGSSWD